MAAPKPISIPAFANTQVQLLEAESRAEIESTTALLSSHSPSALARAGLAIVNLTPTSLRTGLGGKTVVDLELEGAVGGGELPENGIRTGDIVSVRAMSSGAGKKVAKAEGKVDGVEGVVVKVWGKGLAVALGREEDEMPGERLWVVKLANDITYKRMNQVMKKLQKMSEHEYSTFVQVLFGHTSPTPVPRDLSGVDIQFVDPTLNDSQKEAIKFAIISREVALIHGPPGTGKTHTLIELILQLLKQNFRILVCGPSNISVDNIVERLSSHKVPMIRLGHPARLLPSILSHSLDILTHSSEAAAIVRDVRKEMDAKQASIRKTRNGRERRAIYGDLRILRKEYREREKKCVENLIQRSRVVLTTLHGAGGYQLKDQQFDVVIIDEASQALEGQCWVALLFAKKAILAGDHLQLPPTIMSMKSKSNKEESEMLKGKTIGDDGVILGMSLETTLFDRLLDLHGSSIKKMLTTQYRMHEKIMEFPSQELYESLLVASDGVKDRLLKDLPYEVMETDDTREPLVFWDTQGGEFLEKTENEEVGKKSGRSTLLAESKSNEMEVALVKLHVKSLVDAGVHPEDLAVITPYNAQLALLSHALKERFPGIELGSVDGFQGREKEAVIVSLVRSNPEHEVGFLGEKRRLNVAMTRPKRHLAIVGDSETISRGGPFLKRWMAFLEVNADLRYPDISMVATVD